MIALNEEAFIKSAIESCGFADYICLVDGGSTDQTVEIAHESTPDGVELIVKRVEWDNHFGNQRQAAYEMLPDDVTWWMRIDADEAYSLTFQDGVSDMLSLLPDTISAVRIRQTNLVIDTGHYAANLGGFETHPRIFRHMRTDEFWHQWVGEVHEFVQIMSLSGLQNIPHEQIATWSSEVIHYGWLSKTRRLERELLYMTMPGSGVVEVGDLTDRDYVVREIPTPHPGAMSHEQGDDE
jgi:glycosyltransferase involved in cell wall biosynthesis